VKTLKNVLKAVLALDGRLLSSQEKPISRPILRSLLEEAEELHLTLRPVFAYGKKIPTLSGLPGDFLPREFRYTLLSVSRGRSGIRLRYRREN
jgi:hypothetical protein